MKLVPLSVKKKINRFMQWFDVCSAMVLGCVALFGGIGGMLFYGVHGGPQEAQEKTVLQEKVTHLLKTYNVSQSMHTIVMEAKDGSGIAVAIDPPRAREQDKRLKDAFNTEAQQTGIALAHARQLSPHDRYDLYKQLDPIQPLPDFFKKAPDKDADVFLTFSFAQSRVMNRPGFKPTVETAREIISHTSNNSALPILGSILGPVLLSVAGMFGFCAARRRLDASIDKEEDAIRQAERKAQEAARNAEAAHQQAEADRLRAEAAEQERIAKLPVAVATALEHDISVRQIKLAPKPGEAL